jgi:16S rRNA (guanine1207-N2)-methyltransferase
MVYPGMARPGYPPVPQYFDAEPAAASRRQEVELALRYLDRTVRLVTDRGVFAADRIDVGTRLLLDHGPPAPATGDLLDLGCGYGPIAVALALRSPGARVWAVDVNERAVALCAENAAALGLPPGRLRACTPDEVPGQLRFAGIWSNPPIRIGGTALHELLLTWLGRLDEGGRAALVVQKHLGADSLAAWLGGQGFRATRLRAKQGYRILGVEPA